MSTEHHVRPHSLVRAEDRAHMQEAAFKHPLNPESSLRGISLSEAAGMRRVGVHLLRVPPGKESFIYHLHHGEEEWLFVLSGRGVAEIGDATMEIGPGDFLGFATPSVGHHLRNPFEEDLVYLAGGERHEVEVADFPRLGKRLIRVGRRTEIHDIAGGQPMPGFERL